MKTKNFILKFALTCFSIVTPLAWRFLDYIRDEIADIIIGVVLNYLLIYIISTIIFLILIVFLWIAGFKNKYEGFLEYGIQFSITYFLSSILIIPIINNFDVITSIIFAWDTNITFSFGLLPNITVRLVTFPFNVIGSLMIPLLIGFLRGYLFGVGLLFLNLRRPITKKHLTKPIIFAITSGLLSIITSLTGYLWFPMELIGKILFDLTFSFIYYIVFSFFNRKFISAYH